MKRVFHAVLLLLAFGSTRASADPKPEALDAMKWGLQYCQDALNTERSVKEAEENFEKFKKKLDIAVAADPSIRTWTGTLRNMKVNEGIVKCEKEIPERIAAENTHLHMENVENRVSIACRRADMPTSPDSAWAEYEKTKAEGLKEGKFSAKLTEELARCEKNHFALIEAAKQKDKDRIAADDKKTHRCSPSCYEPEPASPNFGKDTKACAHYTKGFCETATLSGWTEPELNQGATFVALVPSCKFPSPNAGKWASLSKRAVRVLEPKRGDVAFIPASSNWESADSSDGSKLRCLDLHWYEKDSSISMSRCGVADGAIVCEASGSKAVRAINIAHQRVDEAKKLKASDKDGCKAAALQAVAFSRGLTKFKAKLGSEWAGGLTYKTRYDGVLKEKPLFAKMKSLGDQATALYKECGGGAPKPTDEDELAFTMWPNPW